jgi:hypothetical protein
MTTAALLTLLVLAAEPPRRAVLVGSNTAIDGRTPLRFAHGDARSLADVLITSGGFAKQDVTVLLDASPADVLAALDQARTALTAQREEGLLVFYYSGHADQRALYPAGKELPLDQLRTRLSGDAAGVRIGIIDACRGGGWTQAKGLAPVAPFEVGLPSLASEGTALLAASSGLEDAHEAETLQGSFFTHYLVSGLRGAADSTGDGQVTLSEAFAYANRLTIRDTASTARVPQHPSFDLRLRGRQDVVLTSSENTTTQLVLEQTAGPLEVVQLSTGVTVAEASPGEQLLRLTLPPGSYLVRRLTGGEVRSKEVQVVANQATRLEESALTLVGSNAVSKGPESRSISGRHELSVGLGVSPLDPFYVGAISSLDYTYFFTRFFGWRALQFSYSFNVQTGFRRELEQQFGVKPEPLSIHGALHTAAAWSPSVISGPKGTELRLYFTLGGGAMLREVSLTLLESATRGSTTGPGARLEVLPAAAGSLEILWMLASVGQDGLGLRLSVSEVMGFSSFGLAHLATANLALVGTFGRRR